MTNWHYERLGEVLQEIKTGSTPPTSRSEYFNGSIPWFTPGDIGDNRRLIVSNRYLSEQAIEKGEAKLFDKYTLLVTCIGEIGRVGVLQIAGSSNQQITALKFKENVDVDFAYYWFIANKRTLERQANQAIVPILNNDLLKRIEFSYPSLPEQQRIAAILAKADRLRRLRRYALDLGESYLQSVFLEMFGDPVTNPMGWEKGELQDLAAKVVDCPHSTPEYAEKQTPYACIRSSDIQNGYLDWSTTKYVICEEYQKRIGRDIPIAGDVIYSREGARFGNAARIPPGVTVCLGQRMMLFRPSPKMATSEFLWAILDHEYTYQQAVQLSGGSASPHVNVGDIKAFETLLPPLAIQKKYSGIVRKHDRLRNQQLEAIRQADHLFQTLLHRAFAGEL